MVFVLTKAIPPIPLGRSAFKLGVVASASHITLEVSPRPAPREVAALYSEIRGRIGLGRDKPFATKHLALAVFVQRTMGSGEGWVELRAQWNEMYAKPHPTWCSKPDGDPEAIAFSLEARTAWRRMTGERWHDRRRKRR